MKIRQQHAIALAIDEQERLLPAIHNGEEVLQHTELLLKGLRLLDVPILITQQYTKGLGMSAPSLFTAAGTDSRLEKRTVSCLGASGRTQKTGDHLWRGGSYLRGADCFGSSAPWIRSFSDRRLCFFQKTLRSGDRHPPDGTGGRGCHQL